MVDVVDHHQHIRNLEVVEVVVHQVVRVTPQMVIQMEVWFMLIMDPLIAEIMQVVVVVQELPVEQHLVAVLHNLEAMVFDVH